MAWPMLGSNFRQSSWGVFLGEFLPAVFSEWRAWLTGSTPMAGLTVTGLVRPEWVAFPLWIWAALIFGAGLLLATFGVYHALRKEHDALRRTTPRVRFEGPFFLVPLNGASTELEQQFIKRSANDL